jgi:hypothetical protein
MILSSLSQPGIGVVQDTSVLCGHHKCCSGIVNAHRSLQRIITVPDCRIPAITLTTGPIVKEEVGCFRNAVYETKSERPAVAGRDCNPRWSQVHAIYYASLMKEASHRPSGSKRLARKRPRYILSSRCRRSGTFGSQNSGNSSKTHQGPTGVLG